MKKLLAFYLMASVVTVPAFAAQDATESEQIKKIVTEEMLMPALLDYSGEVSVQENNGEYTVTVPESIFKEMDRKFPSFSFPLKKAGDFEGKTRYHITLDKLSNIFPVLVPIFEQYNVTYKSVNYASDFVPALNLLEKEDVLLDKLVVPFDEQGANFSIGKISVKTENKMNKSDTQGVQKASFENIVASHLFGNASIASLNIKFSAPFVLRTTTAIDDLLKSSGFKEEMSINDVQIKSLFAQASFNVTQSLDVKQKEDKDLDAKLLINVKDLYVADQEDLPQNVSIDVNVKGFTYEELMNYEESVRAFNEASMLSEGTAKDQVFGEVERKFEGAKSALLDNMVLEVNEVNVNSDKYTAVLTGVLVAKDEQFDGKLTVVNFDYLAPEAKTVDKEACEDVMNRMMSGALSGDAFEQEFNDKCSEKKGPLSSLRPYAASAKHTKLNGQDALVFDVNVKGDNLMINGQPVDIEEF